MNEGSSAGSYTLLDSDHPGTCKLESEGRPTVEDDTNLLTVLHEGHSLETLLNEVLAHRRAHARFEEERTIRNRELIILRTTVAGLTKQVKTLDTGLKDAVAERTIVKEELARAVAERIRYQAMVVRLKQELSIIQNGGPEAVMPLQPLPVLHHDTLRLVFEHLWLPIRLVEPSVWFGPYHEAWLSFVRQFKSILLVCKSWHVVGAALLYRDVSFRRVGQVAAFMRTLRRSAHFFAPLVRTVTFSCVLPGTCRDFMRQSVAYILQHCTRLSGISFQGDAPLLPFLQECSNPADGPSCLLQPKLTTLRLYDEREDVLARTGTLMGDLEQMRPALSMQLSALQHLTSLSIHTFCVEFGAEVHLPQLETLNLLLAEQPQYGLVLPHSWILPSLETLRFRLHAFPGLGLDASLSDQLVRFCQTHGTNVRVLDFGSMFNLEGDISFIERQVLAAKHCHQLRHVVFRIAGEDDMNVLQVSSIFADPINLVHIVYHSKTSNTPFHPSRDHHRGSDWKTVQYIEESILVWDPDFPHIIPTLESFIHEPQIHHHYGMDIVETATGFQLDKGPWNKWSELEEEDDAASSYEPPSDTDGGSPPESESSEFDAESLDYDGSDSEDEAGMVQFTEDVVLGIYSATLDLDALSDDDLL